MKNCTFWSAASCVACVATALGCGPPKFEGEIYIDQTVGNEVRHEVTEARGDRLRQPHDGDAGHSIFDSRDRIWSVDPVKKEILVMDLHGGMEAGDRFVKTQTTETIAGHTCVVWNVDLVDGQHGDVCIAKDVFVGGPSSMWFPKLEEKGLPLRGRLQMPDGKVRLDMRVTRLEAKKIEAARFELPKDYKKVSLFE